MTADIEIRNVSKHFGAMTVLDDLSLSIKAREFIVFLGPSGCGKSTLLRMIAGLETVDSGEIAINNERIDHLPPGRRGIAMVFQSYALYPHMSVRDNMAFGLDNIGMSREVTDARINEAARILEMAHLLERKPGQLSGGQRQRVAIGRAIVKEPKAFLFDEPLSNLDAALRTRTRIELAQLHQRLQSTMIFVTHDQVEAMTLADRIVVMNNRRIEQIGPPMEIYERPATKFVAGFVGAPAMNFVEATLDRSSRNATVRFADGVSVQTEIASNQMTDGKYTFGIRSEDVRIVPAGQGNADGMVDVLERLGERTLIYTRLGNGQQIVGSDVGNSRVAVGHKVGLAFDGQKSHLFSETGRAWHAKEV
ncbi:MAG: sn-glycerol-3-phosphate ABC transporter ATP-binding protein UgpC [Mesorhizobium sp.]|uniref:ABC transporter ATP-binding protein n=1 Tax=Mesorhizobium sp. TaxID=1871066 RepID=UPI000FE5FE5F|nr:sn-glycerol-3-phosphate ABC transporter ATP-binding protein UgpC [Mesorhizobium sp.]RWM05360.1 MAG: sn-glycerol-3-phosphate ABC transporter ATP-binding protein UgpC [Mesorhizobium sp.]TIO52136.1 MAG: sn-glycerol-3-phosphate ABC transporter ATP-binding protein UgpC [Mesorhizobium sp.]TIO60800.1 MAG: sn-glycerol-3-phosphate ABC transporter ATP-binding protein UgpC [Mesorhizobium sp.]TJV65346.1 MAG: sn-glycerol-3-phosphate ABC transporter ATP-binding protein UgpC [Mesorhizobium sp.]